jgi:phage/plasmid-associated DNA primase
MWLLGSIEKSIQRSAQKMKERKEKERRKREEEEEHRRKIDFVIDFAKQHGVGGNITPQEFRYGLNDIIMEHGPENMSPIPNQRPYRFWEEAWEKMLTIKEMKETNQ